MQTTEELQAALLIASEGMQAAKRIIERKNKQLLAAEAEIARLQSALDEIKSHIKSHLDEDYDEDDFDRGWLSAFKRINHNVNRITGTDK